MNTEGHLTCPRICRMSAFSQKYSILVFQSQHNYFCCKGVVRWSSWYHIIYSATKLKIITINVRGINLLCLDNTMWSFWAMEIIKMFKHIHRHTHLIYGQLNCKVMFKFVRLLFFISKNNYIFQCRKGVMCAMRTCTIIKNNNYYWLNSSLSDEQWLC